MFYIVIKFKYNYKLLIKLYIWY